MRPTVRARAARAAAALTMAVVGLAVHPAAVPLAAQTPPAPAPQVDRRAGAACEAGARRVASLAAPAADRARAAGITGETPLRPRLIRRTSREVGRVAHAVTACPATPATPDAPPAGLSVTPLPAAMRSTVRSGYPRDANDGAAWTGRGATVALTAGAELRWRRVVFTVAPTVVFQQNVAFTTPSVSVPGRSPLAYAWEPIDRPDRLDWTSFWTIDAGQSRLAYSSDAVEIGVSTENLWWGPARRYPLLLSNTAPGFPHAFIGTLRPIETPVGRVEAEAVWGRLAESGHFDGDPTNDHRLFGGLAVDLEPRGLDGLFVGIARTSIAAPGSALGVLDGVLAPISARDRDARPSPVAQPDLRLTSVFARWAFPRVGFEVYGEFARQGPWPGFAEFVREPGHGSALTLGVQHVAPVGAGERRIRVAAELTALGQAGDARGTGLPHTTPYVGAGGPQGYTHRGQMLGAWVGPGADAQHIAVDLLTADGGTGVFVERVRFDDDAYYDTWAPEYAYHGHDGELGGGVRQTRSHGRLAWTWTLGWARRWNRAFIDHDGQDHEVRSETNWTFGLRAAWRPGIGP